MITLKSLLAVTIACCSFSRLAQAEEGEFESKAVKIHYVTAGEGEAIVLIHGWMSDSNMWGQDSHGNTKLDTAGVPGFQVIAIDCRGHGKSGKPHEKGAYGAEMANDIVRLLDHLKIKRAHLVGYSMGAFIAGKVAATCPDRVLSIIYGGQAPLIKGEASGSKEIDIFAQAVEDGKGLGPYLMYVWPKDRPKITLAQANAITKSMSRGKDVQAFAAAGLSFDKLQVSVSALRKCKAPILFIYGSKESNSLKSKVANLCKVLGQVEIKVVEGADHISTLTNPEFGLTLVKFLNAHKTVE